MTLILSKVSLIWGNQPPDRQSELPTVVLKEILQSHNASSLEAATPLELPTPLDTNGIRRLARFINKEAAWTASKLKEALKFYLGFHNPSRLEITPFNYKAFRLGLQTPDNIRSLTPCILYAYCYKHGIRTTPSTTVEGMSKSLEYYFGHRPIEELTRSLSGRHSSFYSRLYLLLSEYAEVTDFRNQIRLDSSLFARRIPSRGETPRTPEDAFLAALQHYQMDISSCPMPIAEYNNLRNYNTAEYYPLNLEWNNWDEIRFSETESPLLAVSFKKDIPSSFYRREDLEHHGRRFGLRSPELERETRSLYESVLTVVNQENFYHGPIPKRRTNQTVIGLEDLSTLPSHRVLSYGLLGEWSVAFTYSEVRDYFFNTKTLNNPGLGTAEPLQERVVDRLLLLSTDPIHPGETPNDYTERIELARVIRKLRTDLLDKNRAIANFLSEVGDHNLLMEIVDCMHRLAMSMRGWLKDEDPLPIGSAPLSEAHLGNLDVRVTEAVLNLETVLERLSSTQRATFYRLPTFKYSNGRYVQDTKSILDRIILIKNEGGETRVESCIRTNSNYFAATSYYLGNRIGYELPYEIDNLRYIS